MPDTKKICIIEGHPDPSPDRFSKALCDAYAEGAAKSGHEVKHIRICDLDYGFLSSKEDFCDRAAGSHPGRERKDCLGGPSRHCVPAVAGIDAG